MTIKIVNTSPFPLPAYETSFSAGMDLRASINDAVLLKPLQRALIPTGLFIELPAGFEAQIRPRSGLAFKHGITLLNSPGTIDSDYRGEIKVILFNFSEEDFIIKRGDRIAQMIVAKVYRADLIITDELNESKRGDGGFGHTGKK